MLLHGSGDAIKRGTEFGEQRRACRCQHHPPHRPPEQRRRTQPLFQQPNLLTDSSVGHAKLVGRLLEAAEPRSRLEDTDRVHGRKAAASNEHSL